jgi:hypothetical protein
VAGKRHLEAGGERGAAIDGGNDRLGTALDQVEYLVEPRLLRRLGKLGGVGTSDECLPRTRKDNGADRGVAQCRYDPVLQSLAHLVVKGVERRMVDGQDGNTAVAVEVDELGDGCHNRLL